MKARVLSVLALLVSSDVKATTPPRCSPTVKDGYCVEHLPEPLLRYQEPERVPAY
jgi:hypothetical protein